MAALVKANKVVCEASAGRFFLKSDQRVVIWCRDTFLVSVNNDYLGDTVSVVFLDADKGALCFVDS